MTIRDGQFDTPGSEPTPGPEPAPVPVDRVAYRVPIRFAVIKFAIAAAFALGAWLAPDRVGVGIGLIVAVGMAIYAARDLVAPVRLAADKDAVVAVRGYAGRVRLPWSEIETVRVDSRLRLGRRVTQLEIDADDVILLFTEYDLGVSPTEVERTLAHLRG